MIRDIINEIGPHFHNKGVKTTGCSFKLLTRITVNILMFCALLISMRQFFGDPIDCAVDSNKLKQTIETKCWIEGVYIDKTLLFGHMGKDITRWGVGPPKGSYNEDNFIHQNYYQWIIPMLLLQAFILFMPRVIWRILENGLMSKLLDKADYPIITIAWNNQKTHIVRFLREVSKKQHRFYALKYFFCEISAFLALIFNMALMHWVMNNFWVEYKPAIDSLLNQNYTSFSQHSAKLFPTQAKCFYYDFGSSGGYQKRDALCFLPQNTINEKIFVFLYFWFIFIVVVAFLNLCYSVLMLTFKSLRTYAIRKMSDRPLSRRSENFFYHYSDYGYWFILRLLQKNVSPVLFRDLLLALKNQDTKKEKVQEITPNIEGQSSSNINEENMNQVVCFT